MAIITTKAIVLNSIKYSDSSLIVKCYTLEKGVKSYLIRGVLKKTKRSLKVGYFQPLTQLNIVANHKEKSNLHTIKEVHVLYAYTSIHSDVVKQSILLFLSEILATAIQEEEKNLGLYEYLETAFLWLDTHTNVSNFHLLFLLNLTRFLGFYPDTSKKDALGFHLIEGCFTDKIEGKNSITGVHFLAFKKLLGINFDGIENVLLNKKERHVILEIIIQYFKLHLDGFRNPKSLPILETIFR